MLTRMASNSATRSAEFRNDCEESSIPADVHVEQWFPAWFDCMKEKWSKISPMLFDAVVLVLGTLAWAFMRVSGFSLSHTALLLLPIAALLFLISPRRQGT